MTLFFFNTLSGKREKFTPIREGEANIYTCGPTVYNFAHIGNLRAYVFADTLRRALEYNNYRVKQIMNITDVGHLTSDADEGEDKMVKALKREGKPMTLKAMREVASTYMDAFLQDLQSLNIKTPYALPRASDHIAEDIELIKILEQKGTAYRTSDGMYFDVSRFPSYGMRGGFKLGILQEGARIAVNAEKRNARDFALWKLSTAQNSGQTPLGWESPWGKGFPGWHIECSAMSRKYLGQPFDIHTGGIDHIPVHHQNEIAQSETAYDAPLANYWLHHEHLIMPSGKMAKSGENFLTLNSIIEKGYRRPALTYRYYLLGANYRTPMQFSWDALEGAEVAYDKLVLTLAALEPDGYINTAYVDRFSDAVNNNLDTPQAIAIMWELIRDKKVSSANKLATAFKFDTVLGLDLKKSIEETEDAVSLPADIEILAKKRKRARDAKNWKLADELRAEIAKRGFGVKDTDQGQRVEKT